MKTTTKLTEYTCTDDEGYPESIRAKSPEAAAARYFEQGDYSPDDENYRTYWVHITVREGTEEDPKGFWSHTFAVLPPVPPCKNKRHRWQKKVFLAGGGIRSESRCQACGCVRHRTNWATDPHTGEEGLTDVNYELGDEA